MRKVYCKCFASIGILGFGGWNQAQNVIHAWKKVEKHYMVLQLYDSLLNKTTRTITPTLTLF